VTASSAAGVAVAFGSPIGGVLFSIEVGSPCLFCLHNLMSTQEMSHTFSIKTMWRSFFCALIATVTLSAMNPFRTGKLVMFQVTYDRDWHFFEIIFFIILGVFGVRTLFSLFPMQILSRLFRVCMVHWWSSSTSKWLLFGRNTWRNTEWLKQSFLLRSQL